MQTRIEAADTEKTIWQVALLAGAAYIGWKLLRGLHDVFWVVFGLAMAWYWSGGMHAWWS